MDPLSQGLLGAAAAQAAFAPKLGRWAFLIGAVAGVLPDLDVLIVNPSDPVFGFKFHRHFTHSFLFIPVSAALAALPFLWARSLRDKRIWVLLAALIATATHGALDAATSYGTLLLWPFSNMRVAWDNLPIIDFFFTPVLLLGVALTLFLKRALFVRIALGVALLYAGLGFVQRERALTTQEQLAEARGHTIERGRVLPAPGTLVIWRSIYENGDTLYADGVRTPWLGGTRAKPGEAKALADRDDFPETEAGIADEDRIYETFAWFSNEYVTMEQGEEGPVLADARYSYDPAAFSPLWGIEWQPEGPDNWGSASEERGSYAGRLWNTLTRGDPAYVPLAEAVESVTPPAEPPPDSAEVPAPDPSPES